MVLLKLIHDFSPTSAKEQSREINDHHVGIKSFYSLNYKIVPFNVFVHALNIILTFISFRNIP